MSVRLDAPAEEPIGRGRWVGALIIVAVLAAAGWAAFDDDGVLPSGVAHPTSASWGGMFGETSAAHDPFAALALDSTPALPDTPEAVGAERQSEVCGLGRLAVDEQGAFVHPALLQAPLARARLQMLQGLLTSSDETERAAGYFAQALLVSQVLAPLDGRDAVAASVVQTASATGATGAAPLSSWALAASAVALAAGTSASAAPQALEAVALSESDMAASGSTLAMGSGGSAIKALAGMALGSSSPQVYALAMAACARAARDGVCQMLSAPQWARLDPHNAVPWLYVAEEASRRRDDAAMVEALFHVGQAQVSDTRLLPVVRLALSRLPADTPPFVGTLVINELLGLAYGSAPPYQPLSRLCEGRALADANRRQACLAAGETLALRSGALIDLAVGLRLGERSGWPAERVALFQEERDAASERSAGLVVDLPMTQLVSCAAGAQVANYAREVVAHGGEVGALRFVNDLSPADRAELAQRFRQRHVAAAAATGASAAP